MRRIKHHRFSRQAIIRGKRMACSCCDFTGAAGQQFTAKTAAKELKGYRGGRLDPTTRQLRDEIAANQLSSGTLLDIGAGIGALTFELLDRGVAHAVVVDAAAAYLAAAREEAARRNRAESITFVHGDFLAVAAQVSRADIVAMDRVVCCYEDYRTLLGAAMEHAERAIALSYPRERWFVRLAIAFENGMRRVRSKRFRTFVHPVAEMQRMLTAAGFTLVARQQTAVWAADVYRRRPPR
jgi:magnesium-protoporphyrin O-methyltransferase